MLYRLVKNLSETGEIVFTKDIFENMRMSSNHFYENRPKDMEINHWLTLALVNLVRLNLIYLR